VFGFPITQSSKRREDDPSRAELAFPIGAETRRDTAQDANLARHHVSP
jgi:hypothetical protein